MAPSSGLRPQWQQSVLGELQTLKITQEILGLREVRFPLLSLLFFLGKLFIEVK